MSRARTVRGPVLASTAARQPRPSTVGSGHAGTPLPTPAPAQAARAPGSWVPALARCVPTRPDVPLPLLQQKARPALPLTIFELCL